MSGYAIYANGHLKGRDPTLSGAKAYAAELRSWGEKNVVIRSAPGAKAGLTLKQNRGRTMAGRRRARKSSKRRGRKSYRPRKSSTKSAYRKGYKAGCRAAKKRSRKSSRRRRSRR